MRYGVWDMRYEVWIQWSMGFRKFAYTWQLTPKPLTLIALSCPEKSWHFCRVNRLSFFTIFLQSFSLLLQRCFCFFGQRYRVLPDAGLRRHRTKKGASAITGVSPGLSCKINLWLMNFFHLPAATWYLIPDTCYLLPDTWYLIPDTWYLIPYTW